MGDDSNEILHNNLNDEFNVFHVTHYSAAITKENLHGDFQGIISKLQNKEKNNKGNNNKRGNGTLDGFL